MMRTAALLLALSSAAPAALAAGAPPATVIEGQLSRDEVQKVLERGPQRFVASLRVAPALEKGRFVGFRIEAFTPESPLANGGAIQPGDVVVSVNDEPVERPEQFMRAWEVVKAADRLSVLVLRDGQRLLYRWKIAP
jgi:type II secretory pathway component PulC